MIRKSSQRGAFEELTMQVDQKACKRAVCAGVIHPFLSGCVVSAVEQNWKLGKSVGEFVGQAWMGMGSSFKADNCGNFLEKGYQELKAVDVDVVGVAGFQFCTSNNIWAPNDAEPKEKFVRIGASSKEASVRTKQNVLYRECL
ncbi:unnamed protein product [Cylindrotheca closterium]|uniref:Uncharacterized protein n=1 Tax=Cylindrotheca closterium TaxID=2856 RepID=A0AAD2G555_9STRA|nr:unnamed protein product [Cylindrotheca closterium]